MLVFSLGGHNGHSLVNRTVVDRIVLPTREACEAARQGVRESEGATGLVLHEPGPCEPIPQEQGPAPGSGSSGSPGRGGRGQ
jgi:hypothetical protein